MPNVNIVAHNLPAMFSNRQLGITNNSKAKSAEKLSSGYKINRAADDAAGLSISEKMRKRIRGLNQGMENMQDGVSVCQIADGALNEIQDMLHRMTELAVKSANGTNSESDRKDINQEINQLKLDIDRVAESTKFNEDIYPLKHQSRTTYEDIVIPGGVIKPNNISVDFDYTDVTFDARPFNENTPLSQISLFAQVNGTNTAADGKYYSLLYTGSETANSDWVLNGYASKTCYPTILYSDMDGGSRSVSFNSNQFKFVSFTQDNDAGRWERVFSYQDSSNPNVSFNLKQTVEMDSSGQNYTINTSIEDTGATALKNTAIIMNFDTSYKGGRNGDHNEGYYVNDGDVLPGQVLKESLYANPSLAGVSLANQLGSVGEKIWALYSKFDTGSQQSDGAIPNSFIVGAKDSSQANDWMPFAVEVQLKNANNDRGDFVILGEFDHTNKLNVFSNYGGTGTGDNIYGEDHTFSYGTMGKTNSISFGIINSGTVNPYIDDHLPDTIIRTSKVVEQKDLRIQCSDTSDDAIYIDLVDGTLKGIGLTDADVSTVDNARNTIDLVNNALGIVNGYLSSFGAQQNRLEHAIKVNDNTSENTTAAESRIRDTDMAEEMVKFSKDNILQQAGQSMLAQAQQGNQGILSLLG